MKPESPNDAPLWELVARHYASAPQVAHYAKRVSEGLRPWEQVLADRYLLPAGRLLDVGCGGGREAFALEALGHRVVAIDPCAGQLESARSCARERESAVEFHVCNGRSLEFPDGAFDYVVLWAQVLANVPGLANRERLLREARRVLRPGGRLSFSVHDRDATERLVRRTPRLRMVRLGDGDRIVDDTTSSARSCYWHYFTQPEILELCKAAGVSVLACARGSAFGDDVREILWICVGWRDAGRSE
jgi:SAM-dependent methyltransferase